MQISKLKYLQYSRKSSESRERQSLSIPDQNKECEIYAAREGLQIIYKFNEEKSAFKPGRREKFNKMVELIKTGEANAILTWKPDRICRNPLEGGIFLQLLQDGILKEIRTPFGDVYTPDSDTLILQIHFGMANQYSRNLSQNVRRGLNRKIIDRKEYPRPAIIGFEGHGERGQRNIKPHPITAEFIKDAFDLASTGLYSLQQISDILYVKGLRTRKGKRAVKAHIEQILKNPTYYGYFLWNGELCEGNYEPIISKGLFDLVQEKLKDRSKPKKMIWDREFVGLIRCGHCNCAITTTTKKKYLKKTKQFKSFVYHHCTHRKGNCKEKSVKDSEMQEMLLSEISKISLDKEVWQLGMKLVQSKHKDEANSSKIQLHVIHKQQSRIRDQINTLIEMRTNGELTQEEFVEQKNRLVDKITALDNKAFDNSNSVKTWLELMEDFFNTAFQVQEVIQYGNTEEKQKILKKVGEKFFLKDKRLTFSFKQPFDILLKPEARKSVLALMNRFQTYDWLQEYEPIDYTMATMRQIIQPRAYVS